ncbi:hypothetical protein FIV42_15795 [Persicimonas caeni]|uniref:Uncharacterized protein n=1 Tax=Persicimonas caeni TaxID=2292766 RepID=A0A4Y6PUZ6_PERCE|nr:hypothetical protein [Persicimonas caeni]QDG52152.1 hypothetical protein FIV42_15795 [Persicimonas caeni]QED33374.1 hypothetical protein FRD00_15790 [Persicimonas caeni]
MPRDVVEPGGELVDERRTSLRITALVGVQGDELPVEKVVEQLGCDSLFARLIHGLSGRSPPRSSVALLDRVAFQ